MTLRYLLSLAALAVSPSIATAVPQDVLSPATQAAGGLEAGLASVNADTLRSDIFFIASDEMGGRDSPSPQQRIAARYIRARLMRMGWEPGWKGSYFHPYTLPQWSMDLSQTGLTVKDGKDEWSLVLGTDYFLHSSSGAIRDVAGEMVWIGDLTEADADDFKLDGRWAVGTADRLSSRRRKAFASAGAVGVMVLPPKDAESTVADAQARTHKRMITPSLRGSAKASEFATLLLTETTAKRLTKAMGRVKPGKVLKIKAHETCVIGLEEAELENVMGLWPGSDPKLRNEVIIISAHYDHVGERDNGDIYNGADDNGSGTTGLLSLCEALTAYGPMRRTIMLQWVSAEEKGLLGSAAWTKDPWLPEGMEAVCNVNIDMIGRNAGDELNITPTKDHAEYSWLTRVAEAHSPEEGFPKLGSADDYYWRSDHANYRKNMNIPVAFLFADVHEDYHKPTDTADKINIDKMRRVVRLVVRILDDLQGDKLGK
ncbi:MAG: hypothetical protein ACI8QC_000377 [Planctomycetota bacterium]|jgi:hypothetical protein